MFSFSRKITFFIISKNKNQIHNNFYFVVEKINVAKTIAKQSIKLLAKSNLHFR